MATTLQPSDTIPVTGGRGKKEKGGEGKGTGRGGEGKWRELGTEPPIS